MEKEDEETERAAPVKHSVVYRRSCRDRSREPRVTVDDNLVIFDKSIIAVAYERHRRGKKLVRCLSPLWPRESEDAQRK